MSTLDITSFVKVRLAEDERDEWREQSAGIRPEHDSVLDDIGTKRAVLELHDSFYVTESDFGPRWICRSCDTLVVGAWPCPTLRVLASEWFDHEDYREEWAWLPPVMTRLSWLLPTEVAEALTAAADRIHHGSGGRISKSAAQAALIRAGLDREAEVTSASLSGVRA